MNYFLFFFVLLSASNCFGQNHEFSRLVTIMSNDVCECYSAKSHNSKSFDYSKWDACILNSIKNDEKLLIEAAQIIYGDTSALSGERLAKGLYKAVSAKLIYDCDVYYNSLLEDRKNYFKKYYNLDRDSILKIIEEKANVLKNQRNADYYNLRGGEYFNLQDFDKALKDFDSADILNKKNILSNFYRAQIAEILEDYDDAIKYYEIFSDQSNMFLFHEYADMLRRKRIIKKM